MKRIILIALIGLSGSLTAQNVNPETFTEITDSATAFSKFFYTNTGGEAKISIDSLSKWFGSQVDDNCIKTGNTVSFEANCFQNEVAPTTGNIVINPVGAKSGNNTHFWHNDIIKPEITGAVEALETGSYRPNENVLIYLEWTDLLGGSYIVNYISSQINNTLQLNNFIVNSDDAAKIYFESNKSLLIDDLTGWTIGSPFAITGIHIESDDIEGHYLTVDQNFSLSDSVFVVYDSSLGNIRSTEGVPLTGIDSFFVEVNNTNITYLTLVSNVGLTQNPANIYTNNTGFNYSNNYAVGDNLLGNFEFEVELNDSDALGSMMGLSTLTSNVPWNDGTNPWEFGCYVRASDNEIVAIEGGSGTNTGILATTGTNSVLILKRVGGVITIVHNGNTVYTFAATNPSQLYTHISTFNAKQIQNPKIR